MSGPWKASVSRRPLLAGLGALVGIGVAGGAFYEVSKLSGGGMPRGPYGDLIAGLGDRKNAMVVGKAVLADIPAFNPAEAAQNLRKALGQQPLAEALTRDALQGRIVETQGWVLPLTLAELCALAAKAS